MDPMKSLWNEPNRIIEEDIQKDGIHVHRIMYYDEKGIEGRIDVNCRGPGKERDIHGDDFKRNKRGAGICAGDAERSQEDGSE